MGTYVVSVFPVEQPDIRLPTPTTTLCAESMNSGLPPHLGLSWRIKVHLGLAVSSCCTGFWVPAALCSANLHFVCLLARVGCNVQGRLFSPPPPLLSNGIGDSRLLPSPHTLGCQGNNRIIILVQIYI